MSNATQKWSDLSPRISSAAVMIVVGVVSVWFGGWIFNVLVSIVCGLMVWELTRMLDPENNALALQFGFVSGVAMMLAIYLPAGFALPMLLAPAMVGLSQMKKNRFVYMAYTVVILLAGYCMTSVRGDLGIGWLAWLIAVVVVTDVAGYFAGRMLGGPKFWPRISPKKTWSGTAAGWVGAALVGVIFAINTGQVWHILWISVALSLASQMGDIAESAVKRKAGVKDSSNLIPGHGGVLDRFDGMLGASMLLLVLGQITGFPGGTF